ncbi:MAG TPA: hypothetical protein VIK20_04680 [Bacteroidales bacterium]
MLIEVFAIHGEGKASSDIPKVVANRGSITESLWDTINFAPASTFAFTLFSSPGFRKISFPLYVKWGLSPSVTAYS